MDFGKHIIHILLLTLVDLKQLLLVTSTGSIMYFYTYILLGQVKKGTFKQANNQSRGWL